MEAIYPSVKEKSDEKFDFNAPVKSSLPWEIVYEEWEGR